MKEKLIDLNPILVQIKDKHQLTMNCPVCNELFSIYVNYQGEPKTPNIWGLQVEGHNWENMTISPSINNHSSPRGKSCNAHFSIVNSKIILS